MIVPSGAVRVVLATRPVDFRKGMDGLAALVRESLGSDPFGGVVYVFRSKRADRLKLLLWDGSGLVLLTKRLEEGSFRGPTVGDGVMRLIARAIAARAPFKWVAGDTVYGVAPRTRSERRTNQKLTALCGRGRSSNRCPGPDTWPLLELRRKPSMVALPGRSYSRLAPQKESLRGVDPSRAPAVDSSHHIEGIQ
jgi:transposase